MVAAMKRTRTLELADGTEVDIIPGLLCKRCLRNQQKR